MEHLTSVLSYLTESCREWPAVAFATVAIAHVKDLPCHVRACVGLGEAVYRTLDSVNKVDPSDAVIRATLYRVFSHNMQVRTLQSCLSLQFAGHVIKEHTGVCDGRTRAERMLLPLCVAGVPFLMVCARCHAQTINFWLSTCVLPTETKQHPQRLSATSWNLVEGAGITGSQKVKCVLLIRCLHTVKPCSEGVWSSE